MKKNLRYFMTLLLVMVASVGWGQTTITDVLNQSFTGVTGTNYANWSGKTGTSGADYAGNSAGGNTSIQLRSKSNNSGVVSTTSGGKLKKITVTWDSSTESGRTLNVYGSNTAYSAATDLYDSSKQGTLIGTIECGGASTELTVPENPENEYKYVGLRSASGAMYLSEIKIEWEKSSTETPTVATPTFSPAAGAVAAGTEVTITCATEGATIHYTTNGDNPSEESSTYSSSNPIVVSEGMTIKAIAVKNDYNDSEVATAVYTILEGVTGYTIDFENPLNAYVDWEFENIGIHTGTITAHGGYSYGANVNKSGNAVTTASIQTKEKVANPTTFTCYVSKESNNTTSSTWYVEVSSDGDSWTGVASQSASSMTKGSWTEITANLRPYSNYYVRLRYDGTNAFRAVDDISIVEGGKMTANVTISSTKININETATVSTDENAPAIKLTTSDAAVASVDGATVTGVAAGTATITAKWEEDDNYNGGEKEFTITVVDPNGPGTENNPFTVAQALKIINGLENGETTSDTYFVKGFVVGTPDFQRKDDGTLYGNCNFDIADAKGGTPVLTIFRGKSFENDSFTEENVAILKEGYEVVLTGKLKKYVKDEEITPELTNGQLVSVTATITLNAACTDGTLVYGTYSNRSAFVVPDDIVVSEVGIVDGKLYVEAYKTGNIVPANTGVMVSAAEGGDYTVNLSNDAGTSVLGTDNCLKATGDGITAANMAAADEDCKFYRLTMHNGTTLGFYYGAAEGAAFALGANKAYLAVPASATGGAKEGFSFSEATGINNVNAVENTNEKIFNLAGQQMKSAVKGVYIKNGRKYVK